jgi:hypothetical protein
MEQFDCGQVPLLDPGFAGRCLEDIAGHQIFIGIGRTVVRTFLLMLN